MVTIRLNPVEESVPLEWQVGDVILGTYEVREVFTSGGMANVYRVYHRGWGIDLAVKCPRPEIATASDLAEGLVTEAETWVNLGLYPHIVSCYYTRVLAGIPRIFMEYVNNGSLADWIEHGRLYTGSASDILRRILDIAIQFAWGLHYAHDKGLIHQDIKPANVLLTEDGIAKVTDFGMAQTRARIQAAAPTQSAQAAQIDNDGETVLVNTSGMTPAYCSPEQAALQPLSRRSDIWSWGASVLEMFIGRRTWKAGQYVGDNFYEYLLVGPEVSTIPRMPEKVVNLIRQCFSNEPVSRPRDASALAHILQEVYAEELGQKYPRSEPRVDTILADSLNNRAVSLIDLGREGDALQHFNDALKAQTTHTAATYNRSLHLWRSGRITDREAVAAVQEVRKNLLDPWEADYLLGLLHLERGDYAGAAQIAQEGLVQQPSSSSMRKILDMANHANSGGGAAVSSFQASSGCIHAVEISSQGQFILSSGGSGDQSELGSIQFRNSATGDLIKILRGHTHLVRSLRLSPDEDTALSASWDNTLRLWALGSGECLAVFEGHDDYVQEGIFSPDGKRILSASSDGTVRVWDVDTTQCLMILHGHRDSVSSVATSPGGRKIVTASFDNTLRVWDARTGACRRVIEWTRGCTSNIVVTLEGRRALVGSGDNHIWMVDLETGEAIRSLSGHHGAVNAVRITPNGAWALTAGLDRTVRLWDLQQGRCLRSFEGHTSSVSALAVCAKKALAVSGGSDQTLRLWRLGIGGRSPFITVQPRSTQEIIDLSTQLELILSESEQLQADGAWEDAYHVLAQARARPEFQQHPRILQLWDSLSSKAQRSEMRDTWLTQSYKAHSSRVNGLALLTRVKGALTTGEDGTLAHWDLNTGQCWRRISTHSGGDTAVAVHPDGRIAATGGKDGLIRLWSLEDGRLNGEFAGHTSQVNSVFFSPNGRYLLSASNDQTLRLWDVESCGLLRTLKGHEHYVRTARFTPDGQRAVSVSWDRSVRVWDLESGAEIYKLPGHAEIIEALALSPDGRLAASGGMDPAVRLWDLEHGSASLVLENPGGRVSALAFSVDGRYLFAGQEDGTLVFWEVDRGARLRSFRGHTAQVTGLAVMRDGSVLASTSHDQLLKLWRLDWDYTFCQAEVDSTLMAYLSAFARGSAQSDDQQPGPPGQPAWSEAQFADLLVDLGHRGYGSLNPEVVRAALDQVEL